MIKFTVLFALAAATVGAVPLLRTREVNPTHRIVGGAATTIEETPYQVSVRALGTHWCGGSIISETWILTAAECMSFPWTWYTVRSGSQLSNSGGTIHQAAATILHPSFGSNAYWHPVNDIALIQLSTSIVFDSTQAAISLYDLSEQTVIGAPAIVTGWGATSNHGAYSATLQAIAVPIISQDDCNEAYASIGGIEENHICAAWDEGGLGACQGDTGSPVAVHGRQAGIVSWTFQCGAVGFPGVYTEVAAYRTWITETSGV
ncbi:trypsin-3 [Neodiprion lecontei]|uniref:Trypsin-3 n=1 Tax=Neodiprion lecontei TaxID=441921 RepID=A0A6J0C0R5_NEOLC|nr:trypsin-3 [Neodiprion lecontei]